VRLSAGQGALRATVGSIAPDFKREIEVFLRAGCRAGTVLMHADMTYCWPRTGRK
jgi:hypothetical protein